MGILMKTASILALFPGGASCVVTDQVCNLKMIMLCCYKPGGWSNNYCSSPSCSFISANTKYCPCCALILWLSNNRHWARLASCNPASRSCLVVSTLTSTHPMVDTDASTFCSYCVSDHILQTLRFGTMGPCRHTKIPLLYRTRTQLTHLYRDQRLCRVDTDLTVWFLRKICIFCSWQV